jgi:hypothetical protein
MSNLTITNNDSGNVVLEGAVFEDELLVFGGAGTVVEGTILARVTASGKMTPYVIGGSLGAEIPTEVLNYDVTATGAGDVPIRGMVSGVVVEERLIVDADGDGSNLTPAILDQLRSMSIVSQSVKELNILDNQ